MFYKNNSTKDLSIELFKNPTCEYRGTPFWAWNGKLEKELLGDEIDAFKQMGFGGFHMHSRTGLATPYLSDEFMDMVKFCTQKAKNNHMLAYLYDEDRFPSGAAGGFVTCNPKYRERFLKLTLEPIEHFSKEQAITGGLPFLLATYDIVLNEKGELKKYSRINETDSTRGKKYYAYLCTSTTTEWYNNQTYLDTLNKEAVERFVNLTIGKYKEAVGEDFGKTVPSIFTDEPRTVRKQPLTFATGSEDAIFPWTFDFEHRFKDKNGFDILDKFPEIVWDLPKNKVSRARYLYHDYLAEAFTESFADTYGKICEQNNLALTGHIFYEPTLETQTKYFVGEAMRSYRNFAIPGIDILGDDSEFSSAKQCQSIVHQYGREGMLSELYGVSNWDFDFRGYKWQGDWQAALGVTIRVPHLSFYSMAGAAKRDYPPSIGYQVPWAEEFPYIENHFARLNTALTRGTPEVKVAVVHPIESYWINYGPLDYSAAIRKTLDKRFNDIVEWLLFATIDFDFISEALLPSQVGDISESLEVGKMKYDAVLVPACITLRKSTLDILKKFKAHGGEVIFAGDCPKYIDAIESNAAKALYKKCTTVEYEESAVISAVERFRTIEIVLKSFIKYGCLLSDPHTNNLIYSMRNDTSCKWLFIAHGKKGKTDEYGRALDWRRDSGKEEILIKINGEYTPSLYNTLDGTISAIPYSIKNGKTIIDAELYLTDSLLIRLDEPTVKPLPLPQETCSKPKIFYHLKDKVLYKRSEPNVLLLDHAEYSLNGETFRPEEEILRITGLCRDRLNWPSLRLQPWLIPEEEITDFVTLRFVINSEITVDNTKLALENAENTQITLNGAAVSPDVCGYFTDKAIKTVLLPTIKQGENELIIKFPFGKRTPVEYCYLLGEFNVRLEGTAATIIPKTDTIGFSSLTYQGMPFYGGNVTYELEINTPKCDLNIRPFNFNGALVKVLVDGAEKGIAALPPYSVLARDLSAGNHKIEFVLFGTRINTFGPLHHIDHPTKTGAGHWLTKYDLWCYEYRIKETGILSGPIIEIFEKA